MVAVHPLSRCPTAEPDCTVWRILSCARAAGVEVSDEKLHAVLPGFSLRNITAASARIARALDEVELEPDAAEPATTLDEAIACGLLPDLDAEPACASST